MSGHSKWHKIKHAKGASDAKKGVLFTKLGNAITVAAREGGGDTEANFKLRLTIETAKKANVPNKNIERAIKRGTGDTGDKQIEEVIYEAFGPAGVKIIIQALTDNRNRTINSLRTIFKKYKGGMGEPNTVRWMFEQKGVIRVDKDKIKNMDEVELMAIDLDVQDIAKQEDEVIFYTSSGDLEKIKKELEQKAEIGDARIEFVAKDLIKIDKSIQLKIDSLLAEIEDDPDISDCYTNIE
ncbi:YebC/PmpR family DNA-binding transcriptional regulator [Patescibacteria group bacterium]|nr:YebC/PmpR family DNA-binding transcriptional regulator [Patescibacteria group bacterium]